LCALGETERKLKLFKMLSLFSRIILFLSTAFGGLIVAAHALGGSQPSLPGVQGFVDGCAGRPRPCWFGVTPGITTEEQILQLLSFTGGPPTRSRLSQGYALVFTLPQPWPYCHAIFYVLNGMILRGELSLCRGPDIRVGDLAVLEEGSVIISLPPEELVYGGIAMNVDGWPEIYSHVSYVTLFSPTSHFQPYPFHGFITKTRYCLLVPYYPPCRKR
jgi:hypothetical protein